METDPMHRTAPRHARIFVAVAGPALIALVPMAVIPALPQMAERFAAGGHGALFAQMVMTVPAVFIILATLVSGWLVERLGRRAVMLWALALYTVAGLGLTVAPNATVLIGLRLVLGFCAGLVMTCSMSMVADFPEGGERERVLGFASASAAALAVVAQVVGGVLVQSFGWHGSFLLYALAAPVLGVAWFGATDLRAGRAAVPAGSLRRLLWPVMLLTLVLTIGLFMPGIQGPFLLVSKGVVEPATIGLVLASYSVAAALVAASYGWVAQRIGMAAQIALAGLGMGLGCLLMAWLPLGVAGLALGCIVIGAGVGLVEPLTVTLALQRTPAALHTRAIGLLLSSVFLGQFLNPVLVNPLREHFGDAGSFTAVGVFFIALALLAAFGTLARLTSPALSPTR
jgi:MFS family permease